MLYSRIGARAGVKGTQRHLPKYSSTTLPKSQRYGPESPLLPGRVHTGPVPGMLLLRPSTFFFSLDAAPPCTCELSRRTKSTPPVRLRMMVQQIRLRRPIGCHAQPRDVCNLSLSQMQSCCSGYGGELDARMALRSATAHFPMTS